MIRKLRIIFRTSLKAGILTSLFVLSLALLLVVLWREVRKASDIRLPVGQQHISSMMGAADGHGQDRREVLVLNSYHLGYSWSDNEMRGIVEALLKADPRVEPLIEFLDCKHYPGMEHFDRIRDLFLQKYRGKDFPVVIAADNPALQFALKYRSQLFPRASIVFCGINGFSLRMIEGHENVTGVAELLDAEKTLAIALAFHPGTRTVVVVHDYTITGLATRRDTEKQLKPFAGRVNIVYLPNMPTRELMEHLQRLPSDSLVLALSYSLDQDGQVINHEKISRILSRSAPVPVYGLHEERLGFGIVGGSLLGGGLQGSRAAELATRVFAGEPASRIPVDLRSPTRMMFDHNQLVRFGVPESLLPREAIIVNRPVSLASERPGLVASTLGIIVILVGGIAVLGFNIYQRKIAEDEQRNLHGQLMQAQKMEAVGHLAGGVAHDFNNILTAIIGYANLLRKKVLADEQLTFFADQILSASNRAAGLTRSLLAFSRKQVIKPKPADLNTIVQGIDKIAKRLIGEDIEFRTVLLNRSLTVMADSGQMEQALLNLCTNARDAMPHGGKLTIETGAVEVDEEARRLNFLDRTGWYGIICVSDTGVGMDEKTKKHIFEPFFTTKEVGKGTGLGLSIVYGIIKQHNGTINVYSETGKGTTFKIYLPLIADSGEAALPKVEARPAGGNETILLAEDEKDVRVLITLILREAGYTVIEAATGEEAVKQFAEHADRISLLLSDVIMPKMNGKDAYNQIRGTRPDVKVLFMSGYTADNIKSKGILADGVPLLSKPIIPDQLLRKVREVLDA
jgi:signal transduction histidine kinase